MHLLEIKRTKKRHKDRCLAMVIVNFPSRRGKMRSSSPFCIFLYISQCALFVSVELRYKRLVFVTSVRRESGANAALSGILFSSFSSSCSIECTFIFTKTDFSSCCQRRFAVQTFIMLSLIFSQVFFLSHGQCTVLGRKDATWEWKTTSKEWLLVR